MSHQSGEQIIAASSEKLVAGVAADQAVSSRGHRRSRRPSSAIHAGHGRDPPYAASDRVPTAVVVDDVTAWTTGDVVVPAADTDPIPARPGADSVCADPRLDSVGSAPGHDHVRTRSPDKTSFPSVPVIVTGRPERVPPRPQLAPGGPPARARRRPSWRARAIEGFASPLPTTRTQHFLGRFTTRVWFPGILRGPPARGTSRSTSRIADQARQTSLKALRPDSAWGGNDRRRERHFSCTAI